MITEKNTIVKISGDLTGKCSVTVTAKNKIKSVFVCVKDADGKCVCTAKFKGKKYSAEGELIIKNPILWSILKPYLYIFEITVNFCGCVENIVEKFGIREISTDGKNILLNGKLLYIRGYIRGIKAHDHADNAKLGEREYYRKNILQAKKYGFNFIRFHSTVPSDVLFEVADELGMLIHLELREPEDEYNNLEEMTHETTQLVEDGFVVKTIQRLYNHPSLAVYCIGNELKGKNIVARINEIQKLIKDNDDSRLFIDTCAWGSNSRKWVDIDVQHMSYYFPFGKHAKMFEDTENLLVCGEAEGNSVKEESEIATITRELTFNVPLLAHEVCHYTALRDFYALKRKFEKHGTEKPWWIEEEIKMIEQKGLKKDFNELFNASKLFQLECWKIAFEAIRKSPLLGGFHCLQFADADSYENSNGFVDCFDDESYVKAEQVLRFNGDLIMLTELKSRTAFCGQEISMPILISNYKETADKKADFTYELINRSGKVVDTVTLEKINIEKSGLYQICNLRFTIPVTKKAEKYTVKVSLKNDENIDVTNGWDIWAFPKYEKINYNAFCSYEKDGAIITDDIDKALSNLKTGKNVCLIYRSEFTRHVAHKDMQNPKYAFKATWNRFKPVIWDRGTNYGGLCNNKLLEKYGFGTDRTYGFNYSYISEDCDKIILDDFPVKAESIISGTDKSTRDRFDAYAACFNLPEFQYDRTLRNFSYMFELKVGDGKLLVCGLNLTGLDACEPSAISMAEFIRNYIASADFKPKTQISEKQFIKYLKDCAKEPVKERMMTQFWELDDTPVESPKYWKESREYLGGKEFEIR